MHRLVAVFILVAAPLALHAQPSPNHPEDQNLITPGDWMVRTDRPMEDLVVGEDQESAHIYFVNMTPGWHITTGPAAILYHPETEASGQYRLEAKIHLFDPGERREAFGLFFGGSNLEGDDIRYDYYLLRNSGEFLVKNRRGEATNVISDWSANDNIVTFGPDSEGSVANTLAVEVGGEDVGFFVNGHEVARLARSAVQTDGMAGLRINHALNVHVESLSVTSME